MFRHDMLYIILLRSSLTVIAILCQLTNSESKSTRACPTTGDETLNMKHNKKDLALPPFTPSNLYLRFARGKRLLFVTLHHGHKILPKTRIFSGFFQLSQI